LRAQHIPPPLDRALTPDAGGRVELSLPPGEPTGNRPRSIFTRIGRNTAAVFRHPALSQRLSESMRQIIFAATATACVVGVAFTDEATSASNTVSATPAVSTSGGGEKSDDDKNAHEKVAKKAAQTRRERLIQLLETENKEQQELSDLMNRLKPGEEQARIVQQQQARWIRFADKELDLAREDPKDEIAFSAALSAFIHGCGNKTTTDAADFIANALADNLRVLPAMPQIANTTGGLGLLGQLADKSKRKEIRAAARFAILDYEVDRIDEPLRGEAPLPAEEATAKFAVAIGKLMKLGAEFPDVNVSTRLGESVAEAARKKIDFINNMTVGKQAPDFECELLDGKKAKLSDFRGNVVVLNVWATWCSPCKAMIPHERELVERMKGKPFKFVSLSVDDTKETLTEFLKNEKMPWTHMWNGPDGGFVDQYQIQSYPTIYVLDAKGIIRFKHVKGEQLDHAAETLLKEMSVAN
jgi:thiol-disulfide isomerase/thioredoxin